MIRTFEILFMIFILRNFLPGKFIVGPRIVTMRLNTATSAKVTGRYWQMILQAIRPGLVI